MSACRYVEVNWNGLVYRCQGTTANGQHHHHFTRITPEQPQRGDIDVKTGRKVSVLGRQS